MRAKFIVLGLTTLLIMGSVTAASAYFTADIQTGVRGHTGNVNIHARAQVDLPRDMQPGHRWRRTFVLHNDGRCPVQVTVKIVGLPWFVRASISPTFIPNLNHCQRRTMTLNVWIPSGVGNAAQNKPVRFLILFHARNN